MSYVLRATIEGVVLLPSLFAITTGSLPSNTATQELVVPKSIPIIFPMIVNILIVIIHRPSSSLFKGFT